MWQNILVIIIVAVAAAYVVRQLVRSLTGRKGCDADHCAGCPYGTDCACNESEEKK